MMHSSSDFLSTPNLYYEAWRDMVRSICGRYTPGVIEPKTFSGRARVRSICGFRSVDLSSNAHCLERTHQDVRVDARDHYYAIFQMTGQSRIIQNDRNIELTVGNVPLGQRLYASRILRFIGRIIRTVRSGRYLSPYRQVVHAYLRDHQGSFCRSGLRSLRRGGRGGNLVTLPSEALYDEKLHLQSFHPFDSSGSRRASVGTPVVSENKPAHQRDRLFQRLWRLYEFHSKISPALRSYPRLPFRRSCR